MTYWNETNDSHIKFWDTDKYPSYNLVSNEFSVEGYRGDNLQSSNVLFLGTCDVMSNLSDGTQRWSALLHNQYHSDQPFISLGTVGSGLPTMIRRLYSYIQNYGAPKFVYMTIPRFDGYEYVNKSGKCYNVSLRNGSVRFCERADLITPEESSVWLNQLAVNKELNNSENTKYILEERFAFIEILCKLHNITFRWTFNPSDASIVMLYRNISIFNEISSFMKASFIGLVDIKDQQYDRSIGIKTHFGIFERFVNSDAWDFGKFKSVAESNYDWLVRQYGTELIKMED